MKKRLTYIDVINIIAIFFVLVIHSSWSFNNSALGVFDSVVRMIAEVAVFLFMMNSGAMLINYRQKYDTKTFLVKRLKRVLVPLLFWSVVFYFVGTLNTTSLPNVVFVTDHVSLQNFLKLFITDHINAAFWFFYLIITLYILTPVFSVLAEKNRDVLFYIVILDFIFNFIFVFLNNNHFHLELPQYALPLSGQAYIGFYIMGYLIKSDYFTSKYLKCFRVAGYLSFILVVIISSLCFIIANPVIQRSIGYGGPLNFIYSVGFFIVVKEWVENHSVFENVKLQKILSLFSSLSLGIYILHPFFMKIFMRLTNTVFDSWLDILFMPIFTYVCAAAVSYIIKKIPYVKELLP
ncbi:acyltransferase [Fructobacillus sp. M158]|uniref:acyltransferase n=1 Tax=Fructobacillus parabroussonetiae TaxID=2713174 RepID=UPI00200A9802|nr:acyltransferase [Fructobacillus parabroussonetiae]MCK8616843.1 acyltransferase [Fructobacillus parabroussonetiae]